MNLHQEPSHSDFFRRLMTAGKCQLRRCEHRGKGRNTEVQGAMSRSGQCFSLLQNRQEPQSPDCAEVDIPG